MALPCACSQFSDHFLREFDAAEKTFQNEGSLLKSFSVFLFFMWVVVLVLSSSSNFFWFMPILSSMLLKACCWSISFCACYSAVQHCESHHWMPEKARDRWRSETVLSLSFFFLFSILICSKFCRAPKERCIVRFASSIYLVCNKLFLEFFEFLLILFPDGIIIIVILLFSKSV